MNSTKKENSVISKPTYDILERRDLGDGRMLIKATLHPLINLEVKQEKDFYDPQTGQIHKMIETKNSWSETHSWIVEANQTEEEVLSKALWSHQEGLEKIKAQLGQVEQEFKIEKFEPLAKEKLAG